MIEPYNGNLREKCAVLVVTCDSYNDLWNPFFTLYERFWSERSCDTYLLTNEAKPDIQGIQVLSIGTDISWSDNLLAALELLPHEYVFLFLEDLMLYDKVNNKEFETLLSWAIENDVNYLRFNPSTPPDKSYNKSVGIVSAGTLYRASVVTSLFKKSVLKDLLVSGENAWKFETFGTIRSDKYDKFFSTYHVYFPILNTVIKGVWEYDAYRKVTSLGIVPDLKKRRLMNLRERIVWKSKLIRSYIFSFFPANMRRELKLKLAGR